MEILVAEDNDLTALLIRLSLARLGHEVTIARDGLEAWRMVEQGEFPLIISDWMMPGLDGPDLCRKIRGREGRPYCYIILLTSKSTREERLEGLRAGADDFLVKPVDGDELAVRLEIAARILSVQRELERRNALLSEVALIDELTGLMNRRGFRESIDRLFDRSRRAEALSLVILDVDHFKGYNDAFGHPAGDEALRVVAALIRDSVRGSDGVSRIGGEEFAVLLPDTDTFVARELAERLRSAIAGHAWPLRPITASLGIATTSPAVTSADSLVDQADRALYRSKRSGRDRACHFVEEGLDALGLPLIDPGRVDA